MFFQRLYDRPLAQASYLIGCQRTGEALVVDPNRDINLYLETAVREKLRITHITETHIHADFVSGARELAHCTGAQLLLSDEGGPDWRYSYAKDAHATLLHDGDSFMVGNVRIDVLHTPGHTPEHLSFIVTDTVADAGPWGILTGDFVFVGDVGRPDLLERAAGHSGTMEAGGRTLFQSLKKFRTLPDHLQLWPGHGAGSACGKALGAVPASTIGYEKIANWGLTVTDENEFVRMVLEGQPEPPRYFAEMKRINRDGAPFVSNTLEPPRLQPEELQQRLDAGDVVVDIRPADRYEQEHIPGTISIPLSGIFNTWAGWFIPYDKNFYLLAADGDDAAIATACSQLRTIGLDSVAGVFTDKAIDAWKRSGRATGQIRVVPVEKIADVCNIESATVIDVRGLSEWQAGHVPGVRNIPAGWITEHPADLPKDACLLLCCQGGARSHIAASVLQARGYTNVASVTGGYQAWLDAGFPVEYPNEQGTNV